MTDGPTRREAQPENRLDDIRTMVQFRSPHILKEWLFDAVDELLRTVEQRDAQLASLQQESRAWEARCHALEEHFQELDGGRLKARAEHAEAANREAIDVYNHRHGNGIVVPDELTLAEKVHLLVSEARTALRERDEHEQARSDWHERFLEQHGRAEALEVQRLALQTKLQDSEVALAAVQQQLEQEKAK